MARACATFDLTWLEEPVSPPGDHAGLARVRVEGGVPIAAGENAAGLHDFRAQFEAGALDVAQPSVIKIGGPSAMLEIAALAKAFGVRVVPHNAYFGPGFLASLHVNATIAPDAPFERLFIDLEASPAARAGGGEGRQGRRCRTVRGWAAIPTWRMRRDVPLHRPMVIDPVIARAATRRSPASPAVSEDCRCIALACMMAGDAAPLVRITMKITRLRTQIVHLPIDPPIQTSIWARSAPPIAC